MKYFPLLKALQKSVQRAPPKQLNTLLKQLENAGIKVTEKVCTGEAAAAIVGEAQNANANLVVMGSRRLSRHQRTTARQREPQCKRKRELPRLDCEITDSGNTLSPTESTTLLVTPRSLRLLRGGYRGFGANIINAAA